MLYLPATTYLQKWGVRGSKGSRPNSMAKRMIPTAQASIFWGGAHAEGRGERALFHRGLL